MDKVLDFSDITEETAQYYDFANCHTRVNREAPYNARDVVAAIYASEANLRVMSTLLGRNRMKIQDYINSHPEVKQIFSDYTEGLIDDLQRDVFRSAREGDKEDRRFVLRTLGKNRGFTTRGEITGAEGGPVDVVQEVVLVGPDEYDDDDDQDEA